MGKWLKKVGRLADKVRDKVRDTLKDEVVERLDIVDDIRDFIAQGKQCAAFGRETIDIVDATVTKREQMIDFGAEIQATLQKFTGEEGEDKTSLLDTIKALTAGDKVKAAMEIAKGLDVTALQCVEKSKAMIDALENGMDALPPRIQTLIETRAEEEDDEDDVEVGTLLQDLDRDMMDVKSCIESIQQMSLATAFKVGMQAFTQLTEKAQRSRSLFDKVRAFAVDVQEIADAFESMNPIEVSSKSRDMMRCLRKSEDMHLIAEGAGKLIQCIIPLFAATADRISDLWAALAFARDCLMDCVSHVKHAKQLCVDAKDRSLSLVEKSKTIQVQLKSVGKINMQSLSAVRSLTRPNGDMHQAIELAKTMDNLILDCSNKVTTMVDRVSEGFHNLPAILTTGITVEQAGNGRDDAVEPPNVETDIGELDQCRSAMDESDIVSAGEMGLRGFAGVSTKAATCNTLLDRVQDFADNCSGTIESFMSSSWDLEAAVKKVTEMCQLVNLGELMKKFSDQIKRLVLSIIALLKSVAKKFAEGIPKLTENMEERIDSVKEDFHNTIEAAKDKIEMVDDLTDQITDTLQFWK